MKHDNAVHHPLGAAAYYYQDKTVFLLSQLRYAGVSTTDREIVANLDRKPVIVHLGTQPNNSPHAGTLICFALGFAFVRALLELCPLMDIAISLDFVDSAPDNEAEDVPQGYQRSHKCSGRMEEYMGDYSEIMDKFSKLAGDVRWTRTFQKDLNSQSDISVVVRAIVAEREVVGPMLSPKNRKLPLRAACPHEGCGLTDKIGEFNEYYADESRITFLCPRHGRHSIWLDNPVECTRLEYNTPLRNLIRNLVWGMDTNTIHMRVTGSDYAGTYQEDMFFRPWRHMMDPPVTVFSPLLTDWAGSKLSKSLYVKQGAYQYLQDQGVDYLLSFARMKVLDRDPAIIFREVSKWIDEPMHLFTRSYSIEYIHRLYTDTEGED
ncbi:hypothetical protein F5887DRAFT_894912 [Amanita rubescens]|nr:hypothetical protein F5887DRAFT_894912 [Amanita rubescens]